MIHAITRTQYSLIKKSRAREKRLARALKRDQKNDGFILFKCGNVHFIQDDQSFHGLKEIKEFKKKYIAVMKNQSSLL